MTADWNGVEVTRSDGTAVSRRVGLRVRVAGLVVVALLGVSACSGPSSVAPGASDGATSGGLGERGTAQDTLAFTATTLAGEDLDAATLAGEPVVLWFWTPWCTICRAEAPGIARVAADLDGQVTFVGVPGFGEEADMRAFVEDTGTAGLEHLVDADGSLWQRFEVVSQPAFAFVAADGSMEVFAGALGEQGLRERAESLAEG